MGKSTTNNKSINKQTRVILIITSVLISILITAAVWFLFSFIIKYKIFLTALIFLLLNISIYIIVRWKHRKIQTLVMGFISLLLSAVMIFSTFFWSAFIKSIYNYDTTFPEKKEELAALPEIDDKIINIALFGIDTRNMKSYSGNSDSIMILSLDTGANTVKIISVMRDSLVPIERESGTVYGKINSAYARGRAELAVRTLNKIFNLDITEYATVNFYGMAKIIDSVGGIDVELTSQEVVPYRQNSHAFNAAINEQAGLLNIDPEEYYITESGVHHLNGIQAVAYSRIRYVPNVWGTNNDFGRTDRQRFVMRQLFNKALTLKKSSYPTFIKTLLPYMATSLDPDEILSIALKMLKQKPTFAEACMPKEEYRMPSPKGSFGSVAYYDLDFASNLIHAFLYENITFDEYTAVNGITKNNWYANR